MSMNYLLNSNKKDYSMRFSKTMLNLVLISIIMAAFSFSSSSGYAQNIICADLTDGTTGSKTGPWSPASPDYNNYFTFYTPGIYSYLILQKIQ